jgi:hypothetical protein
VWNKGTEKGEPGHAPSGVHQEHGYTFHIENVLAVWSERSERQKQTKRPSGNWTAFSSRENSSNGGSKRPSELSGEILLGSERQCQEISPE